MLCGRIGLLSEGHHPGRVWGERRPGVSSLLSLLSPRVVCLWLNLITTYKGSQAMQPLCVDFRKCRACRGVRTGKELNQPNQSKGSEVPSVLPKTYGWGVWLWVTESFNITVPQPQTDQSGRLQAPSSISVTCSAEHPTGLILKDSPSPPFSRKNDLRLHLMKCLQESIFQQVMSPTWNETRYRLKHKQLDSESMYPENFHVCTQTLIFK